VRHSIVSALLGTFALAIGAGSTNAGSTSAATLRAQTACPGASLSGTVTYLQRIALEPEAMLEVRLENVSKADAPAEILSVQTIPTAGRQVPIPFELCYDAAKVVPTGVYALRAQITVGGALRWTTDTRVAVLRAGQATTGLELRVVPVTPAAATPTTAPDALANSHWELARYTLEGRSVRLDKRDRPELHFTPEGVSGNSGCNRFAGAYSVNDDALKIERVAGTLMLCADARNALENDFLRLFRATQRFKISNDRLTLTITGSEGRLVFSRILMR
jgi:putative lipoprotein